MVVFLSADAFLHDAGVVLGTPEQPARVGRWPLAQKLLTVVGVQLAAILAFVGLSLLMAPYWRVQIGLWAVLGMLYNLLPAVVVGLMALPCGSDRPYTLAALVVMAVQLGLEAIPVIPMLVMMGAVIEAAMRETGSQLLFASVPLLLVAQVRPVFDDANAGQWQCRTSSGASAPELCLCVGGRTLE
jgi:hypothetical protein